MSFDMGVSGLSPVFCLDGTSRDGLVDVLSMVPWRYKEDSFVGLRSREGRPNPLRGREKFMEGRGTLVHELSEVTLGERGRGIWNGMAGECDLEIE